MPRLSLILLPLVALMWVAAATFAAKPVSAERERVPVFLIGEDTGLSPFVIRRDSKEFKEVVFPPVAQAMAKEGLQAIGEEPFRAKFNVDGVPGECCDRWIARQFLYHANQVSVDDEGNTAPYMVTLSVWIRGCRDEEYLLCVAIYTTVYDTGSRERLFGAESKIRIPFTADCRRDCALALWPPQAEATLYPLGMKIARFISKHRLAGGIRTP